MATYLVDLANTGADPDRPAKGAKVATVSLALSAIAAARRTAGHTLDTRGREIRSMKCIRKTYAAPQRQAEPLKPPKVRGVLASLGDSPVERRDAALVALLLAAAATLGACWTGLRASRGW